LTLKFDEIRIYIARKDIKSINSEEISKLIRSNKLNDLKCEYFTKIKKIRNIKQINLNKNLKKNN
jgi:hypothetical protein